MIGPPGYVKTFVMRGYCYQNSFKFVELNPDWTLVHGIPVCTDPNSGGERMGHAWAENGEWVYDPTADVIIPKAIYYLMGQIDYAVEYSKKERRALALKHLKYGPWDKKIDRAKHSDKPKKCRTECSSGRPTRKKASKASARRATSAKG